MRNQVLALPRSLKRLIVIGLDCILASLSVWVAYYLRIGELLPLFTQTNGYNPIYAMLLAIIISIPTFMYFGLYRVIFRYAGGPAIYSIFKAVGVYTLLFAFLISVITVPGVPRTIGFIQPLVLLLFISAVRMAARFWLGEFYRAELVKNKLPQALIYGAGTAGRELAAALSYSHDVRIAGFIDDDAQLQGSDVSGHRVYSPKHIEKLIDKKNISQIMLAMPRSGRKRRNEIIQSLLGLSVTVRILPSTSDLSQGRISVSDIRELTIDEILGRDPVVPDDELLTRDIKGKIVLVSGAGGSIGSELCRQIFLQQPSALLLLDHSEFALYQISEELSRIKISAGEPPRLINLLGSVTDGERLSEIFKDYHPDTVYHAAAYKHVPLVEDNPFQGLENNTFGTLAIAECAIAHKVKKFVLISTDKAVRPTNVMGASKRLAEMVLQGLSTTQSTTIFAMVRFGNVLNSSGSVVPLFREQIKNGGPVTVTHKEVTRYFMTIEEAASLVLQAGAMTTTLPQGEEAAPVYLLDMGEPVKIYELAKKMIELSGLKPITDGEGDIEISFTGLRPGEKLYEELLIGENAQLTQVPKIRVANEQHMKWDDFKIKLAQLEQAKQHQDRQKLENIMRSLTGKI